MTYIHTTPWAVYNEIDEYAADWLENLIAAGLIANGIVDRRSIVDVRPDDYRGFRQVHLFAGIGVWSYGFRRAGVSDDTALWSLSCPCQPFSAAGKGAGVDDERHLWPHAHHLIRERRPAKIYGEQVASKDGLAWLDIVQTDMEGTGYAFGAVDTCSASVGAPHIRQRLRFHAYDLRSSASRVSFPESLGCQPWSGFEAKGSRLSQFGFGDGEFARRLADCDSHEPRQGGNAGNAQGEGVWSQFGGCSQPVGMDNDDEGLEGFGSGHQASIRHGQGPVRPASETSEFGGLADSPSLGRREQRSQSSGCGERGSPQRLEQRPWSGSVLDSFERASPTNGFWRNADWLFCRDGKWRPVEPGTFPLAHGAASRVGRLRAYGNAVDAEATREFIEATLEHETLDLEAAATLFEDVLG
ncbi:DNA cytosine methyltransferase [Agrobacterium tumefaciens]|nr:DNA cytosine methyltransferase [Agrobacterium tumefaciens]NTA69781.1 DNA cytosine methyltransferase [Agrobacterium tumefaciens]